MFLIRGFARKEHADDCAPRGIFQFFSGCTLTLPWSRAPHIHLFFNLLARLPGKDKRGDCGS